MPIYSFENKVTGEQFDLEMSMADRETYLKENPDIEQILTKINIVDPVGIGVTKLPSDYAKHVLGKVKNAPGADKSKIEKRWSVPREW